jgi:hypothetical protein
MIIDKETAYEILSAISIAQSETGEGQKEQEELK